MSITVFPMQNTGLTFGEAPVYRLLNHLFGVGAVSGFAVTQNTTPNLSVTVTAGDAYAVGGAASGGKRLVTLSVDSNSGTPGSLNTAEWLATFGNADATNPRVDRVVLQIQDNLVDGGSGQYRGMLKVVAGAATAGATLLNLTGAAAVPANTLLLANVLVRAGATTITTADIDATVLTPAFIGSGNVAVASIATGGLLDGAVTTNKLAAAAVTANKLAAVFPGKQVASGYNSTTITLSATGTTPVSAGIPITVDGQGSAAAMWIEAFAPQVTVFDAAGNNGMTASIYDGAVETARTTYTPPVASSSYGYGVGPMVLRARVPAFTGTKTFNLKAFGNNPTDAVQLSTAGGTGVIYLRATWDG